MIPDTITDEGFILVSESRPQITGNGRFWFIPSTATLLVSYNGQWLNMAGGGSGGSGGGANIVVGSAEPAFPTKGFLWFDTNPNILKIWTGLNWMPALAIPNLSKVVTSTDDASSVTPKAVFDYVTQMINQIGAVAGAGAVVRYDMNGKIPYSVLDFPVATTAQINSGTSTNTFITPAALNASQYAKTSAVASAILSAINASEAKTTAVTDGLAQRMTAAESKASANAAKIQAMEAQGKGQFSIGDLLDVDLTAGQPRSGQVLTYDRLHNGWIARDPQGGGGATGGIPDAPTDGNLYARSMASWVQIPSAGGTATHPLPAPSNGQVMTVSDMRKLLEDDSYVIPVIVQGGGAQIANLPRIGLGTIANSRNAYLERVSQNQFDLMVVVNLPSGHTQHIAYTLTIADTELAAAQIGSTPSLEWDITGFPLTDDYQGGSSGMAVSQKAITDLFNAVVHKSGGTMTGDLNIDENAIKVDGLDYLKKISINTVNFGDETLRLSIGSEAVPVLRMGGHTYKFFTEANPPTVDASGALSATNPVLRGQLDLNDNAIVDGHRNVLKKEQGVAVIGDPNIQIRIETINDPYIKIGTGLFKIFHEGNVPTLDQLHAAPELPSNAIQGNEYVMTTKGWAVSSADAEADGGSLLVIPWDFTSQNPPFFKKNGEIYMASKTGHIGSAYQGIDRVIAGQSYWFRDGHWEQVQGSNVPIIPSVLNTQTGASVGANEPNMLQMLVTRDWLINGETSLLSLDSNNELVFDVDSYTIALNARGQKRDAITATTTKLVVGDERADTQIASDNNPTVLVNGRSYEIYHEGNKPSAADLGMLSKAQADTYYLGRDASIADLSDSAGVSPVTSRNLAARDLNTLITPDLAGWWYQADDGAATVAKNYPNIGVAGALLNMRNGKGYTQLYYPSTADFHYTRHKRLTAQWTSWKKVHTEDALPSLADLGITLSSSTSSTSTTTFASSSAVNDAMTKAEAAFNGLPQHALPTRYGTVRLATSRTHTSTGYAWSGALGKANYDLANSAKSTADDAKRIAETKFTPVHASASTWGLVKLETRIKQTGTTIAATPKMVTDAVQDLKDHLAPSDVGIVITRSKPATLDPNKIYMITG